MSPGTADPCAESEQVALYALGSLPYDGAQRLETHLATCQECRNELASLRSVVESFAFWPVDILRPSDAVWDRLARRIQDESGAPTPPASPRRQAALEWEEVGPGISCKLLATDLKTHRVSMLVRLDPGASYPPHLHAGTEELHLLAGELWIDDHKLHPGDYNRAVVGTRDHRVSTDTGCTCVLITSTRDTLT
jgi:anti-sigma factor ChrR (cupin superfamily)